MKIIKIIALLALGAFAAVPAFATAELKLSDGTNSVTILDNGGLGTCVGVLAVDCVDKNGSTNQVTFIGVIGTWTLNVTTGASHGAAVGTDMDLNTTQSTSAASTLTITFSDDGFGSGGTHVLTTGGTLQGSATLTFSAFAGATKFAETNQIGSNIVITANPLQGTSSGAAAGTALTIKEVFAFTAAGSTSSNTSLTTVPEPGSIMLLGGALLVTMTTLRNRMKKA